MGIWTRDPQKTNKLIHKKRSDIGRDGAIVIHCLLREAYKKYREDDEEQDI